MRKEMNYPSYEEASKIAIENGIMGAEEYRAKYKELGLPSNPNNFYKEEWLGWHSFLGKDKKHFPSYEETKRLVNEAGIKSIKEYKAKYKELGLPSEPNTTYKDKGWSSWGDFFDTKEISYEEAHRIVVEAGIKSGEEYKARCKELGLPSHPDRYYKGKSWVGWPSFFGKETIEFPSYEEAKKAVIQAGIQSSREYMDKNRELGLPSSPHITYKGKGWSSWDEFFGRPHKITPKERRAKVSRLSLDPILLDDKAPLQVLYMVASCVDKNLAREIETLLDSTTPEDRLNWVKEQLKDVKEETTSGAGTASASPDEVSAMESMMDVFEDTFEDLSEENSTNIQIILENYYHNVINKELIGECDG